MEKILCLAAGSLAGGFGRWLMTDAFGQAALSRYPLGTFAVNLLGCLLIGFFFGLGESRLGEQGRLLWMTGFCGAFTTFSTWILDAGAMADRGDWRGALAYLAASVLLGFLLFRSGTAAAAVFAPAEPALAQVKSDVYQAD